MLRSGARSQNLGHLRIFIFALCHFLLNNQLYLNNRCYFNDNGFALDIRVFEQQVLLGVYYLCDWSKLRTSRYFLLLFSLFMEAFVVEIVANLS